MMIHRALRRGATWNASVIAWAAALALISVLLSLRNDSALCAQSPSAQLPSAQSPSAAMGPGCIAADRYFEQEVWAKVAQRICLKCHCESGEAADSNLLLSSFSDVHGREAGRLAENRRALERLALEKESGQSRLLLKASGGLDHGGGEVLKPDSTAYRVLQRFVDRLESPGQSMPRRAIPGGVEAAVEIPFFEGVAMLTPERHWRRVTLSLAARLPSVKEIADIEQRGGQAIDSLLDQIMQEDAFYVRLKEGFNDIFLTLGIEDNAETLLSYDHFEKTRLWTQKHDLSHLPEADRQKARYKLANDYRQALLDEPLELIAWIVRHDRPFTELVTADYIMVSPYTARGYGIFDELKDQFQDVDDPFEYIPARLKALKNRQGRVQESPTGLYPHAGFLSMFHYLRRYPTTETNRNRLRARMFYQHFLGIDVMQLAPRSTDSAAVAAKYEIPTMQAADCVVCHKTIDPVAGLFQDFSEEGYLKPRKEGWYRDMFAPGFEGEDLPDHDRWRAPQWLAERTIRDPRFPIAMVEHVYSILMGRKVLQPPDDIDDPFFTARRRAYLEQRRTIEAAAEAFKQSDFNLKTAFKQLIASDFYRADGTATLAANPERRAELDDVGIVRLLPPEQLERKIDAIFGKPWGRLNGELKILYGGIDSITVTERNSDPSGAMGAIQRIMANDVACQHVALDFARPPSERRLFPDIEPDVVPGDEVANEKIRRAIVYLHRRLLGRVHATDHPEVDRTYSLFAGIVADAAQQASHEPRESYFCGRIEGVRVEDPHYTIRAWRGVVTYLLRQHDFLVE